ncbi:MAG: outer membrane protein assembly factor BamA [Cardiobacteriaceae bacterium]|nr:outer membrane protein assembly factor BamA [Cardiobacteriaceae bacterium]
MPIRKPALAFSALAAALLAASAHAAPFVIKDIRIEGLQRVSSGSVFSYLPLQPGQRFDVAEGQAAIAALYASELFADIRLRQDGNDLVIIVEEFPVIAEINVNGNREIKNDDLRSAMSTLGLVEGQSFNPAKLNALTAELTNQYQTRSKYAVEIKPEVRTLPRGRVAIDFNISEGRSARIQEIAFVGNKVYSDDTLRGLLDTDTPRWHSFLSKSDQYNPEKVAADLERLSGFYENRGFLDFKIVDSNVALSADRQALTWTISIDEGPLYMVKGYDLSGDTVVPREVLEGLVAIEPGAIYRRDDVSKTIEALRVRLADEGYAQADVAIIPDVDHLTRQIHFDVNIRPGQKTYVRQINFAGNEKTYDRVLRRELRQQEASPYSSSDIARGEERIQRLPQVAKLDKQIVPVEGSDDQVDINYTIKEQSTSYIQGGVGYGQSSGALFNIEYTDDNFFGTGNRLGVAFGKSSSTEKYGFNFTDPYFTADGISLDYNLYYEKYNFDKEDLSDWASDNMGALLTFGYPLSEYQTFYFGGGYRGVKIQLGDEVASEIRDYVAKNGRKYHEGVLTLSWLRDTTNHAHFPTKGASHRISGEFTIPGSDDTYYKLGYKNRTYFNAANESLIIGLKGDINLGGGFGDNDSLPFYRKYYAGGINTVRGFEHNSLGPKYKNGDTAGGDFRVNGSVEMMVPLGKLGRESNLRLGTFVDVGNVYARPKDFDAGELRYSAGLFLQWMSPIGPLNLSYGFPLNKKDGDKTEKFQFTLGTTL